MKTIIKTTVPEILEAFARKQPNCDKMFCDFGRNSLFLQFGQYGKDYKISDIVSSFESEAKKRGMDLEIKGRK